MCGEMDDGAIDPAPAWWQGGPKNLIFEHQLGPAPRRGSGPPGLLMTRCQDVLAIPRSQKACLRIYCR